MQIPGACFVLHSCPLVAFRVSLLLCRSAALLDLARQPVSLADVHKATPLAALTLLARSVPNSVAGRAIWRQNARMTSVMGSCPESRESFLSAIRHWIRYIDIAHGEGRGHLMAFPPQFEDGLGWANAFRCAETWANYLSHLRGACHAWGFQAPPTHNQAISRVMMSIVKRQFFDHRPKRFISKVFVCNMVAAVETGHEQLRYAMLSLFSYVFLLRMPSEALGARKGSEATQAASPHQTVIWRVADTVCIRIRKRKNRPQDSGILCRTCSCASTPLMCVVHTLWDRFFANLAVDDAPWADISAAHARDKIQDTRVVAPPRRA